MLHVVWFLKRQHSRQNARLGVLILHEVEVLLPLVANHLPAGEAPDRDNLIGSGWVIIKKNVHMDKSVRCKIHLTVRHSAKHYMDKKQSRHCSNREGLREADPRTMM